MPFNSENASVFGRKGGKQSRKDKDPSTVRSKQLVVKVSPAEYTAITEKATEMGLSKTEFIVRSTNAYTEEGE